MASESEAVGGTRPASGPARIGLALAGGAPEGAIWEIGALRALDEAVTGLDFKTFHVYVGVSSGAVLAACLANDMTTSQLCRAALAAEPDEPPFVPDSLLRPATRELARGGRALPGLVYDALRDYLMKPGEYTLLESLMRLTRALPVGFFDNEPMRTYLEDVFSIKGRTDDFRQLAKHLVVVAADLDSGQAVRFGEPGHDHVPISLAVQASTALPGLYPPVEIEGRHYVDGVLLKTLHASVALDAGADLVLCINPIVPVDTAHAVETGAMRRGKLLDRGLPSVLSQTFRTMIHSRMEVGLATYQTRYKDADVVLIEPERDDYKMFFTNIFGFSERRAVCEHAYQATRRNLLARYDTLEPVLARHGVTLRKDVLEDQTRALWPGVGLEDLQPARRRWPTAGLFESKPQAPKAPRETPEGLARRLDDVGTRLDRLLAAQRGEGAS
jgi:NTE family protein